MPTYCYVCPKCNMEFEIDKKISEYEPHEECPECHEPANRNMQKGYCSNSCSYIVNTTGFYGKVSI